MYDGFQWWAQIIIPSAVGVLTLFVSAVALWVSHRSTVLANAVEKEREAATATRETEASQARLRDLAVEEARSLYRWFAESTRQGIWWPTSRPMGSPEPPRSPLEVAKIEAETALQHSLVPGAADLLAMTVFDLENRNARLPERSNTDEDENAWALEQQFLGARDQRTLDRIRRWAFDPEAVSRTLPTELENARNNQPAYLRAGLNVSWAFPTDVASDYDSGS